MAITTLSSREFNQDTITDRGRPAHVLLSIEQYQALVGPADDIVDLLAMPSAKDIEFDPPRARRLFGEADLS